MSTFKDLEHTTSVITTTPLSLLPKEARHIKCEDGAQVIYNPNTINLKGIMTNSVKAYNEKA